VRAAARSTLDAFQNGKHVVLVNAELDSFVGPILKAKADQAGVVVTHTDGDEPGVAMTLLRYLRSTGLRPVAAGNIKGMVDYDRYPETPFDDLGKLTAAGMETGDTCGRTRASRVESWPLKKRFALQ
jgi:predicted homoserine dehydrogenase-like protein